MEIIYVLMSFISFIGAIVLLFGFRNKFKSLTSTQKAGIVLVEIGTIIPFLIGITNGFIYGVMNH